MKKILLLGSVAGPCPPLKAGGTERVAYVQAKELAKRGIDIIFVGGIGTKENFRKQLELDNEKRDSILEKIEIIEIGGNTQIGNASDSIKLDPSQSEASRKLRLEMVYLGEVIEVINKREKEYDLILNNLRGEAVLIPFAFNLNKNFVNVMHLNLFPQLASFFSKYNTKIITISDSQKKDFPNLKYLSTINNSVNTKSLTLNHTPKNYALMLSTIGHHKNQKAAIKACLKANIPLILGGKIRDLDYFEKEIKPLIDNKKVKYVGEIGFPEKKTLYQNAKVFLFPILWQEPFGLVLIEALSCGTPVIAFPNGGPKEIILNGKNGFLVKSVDEMAKKIGEIDQIDRNTCRLDVIERFDDKVIGDKYSKIIKSTI